MAHKNRSTTAWHNLANDTSFDGFVPIKNGGRSYTSTSDSQSKAKTNNRTAYYTPSEYKAVKYDSFNRTSLASEPTTILGHYRQMRSGKSNRIPSRTNPESGGRIQDSGYSATVRGFDSEVTCYKNTKFPSSAMVDQTHKNRSNTLSSNGKLVTSMYNGIDDEVPEGGEVEAVTAGGEYLTSHHGPTYMFERQSRSCVSSTGRPLYNNFTASSYRLPKLRDHQDGDDRESNLFQHLLLYTCSVCNTTYVYHQKSQLAQHKSFMGDDIPTVMPVAIGIKAGVPSPSVYYTSADIRQVSMACTNCTASQTSLSHQRLEVARLTMPDIYKMGVYRNMNSLDSYVVGLFCHKHKMFVCHQTVREFFCCQLGKYQAI